MCRMGDMGERRMSDLIRRQTAISAIKEWGLIDGLSEGQAIEILADEEKVPSAQPEIIRCKDCGYYDPSESDEESDWCHVWGETTEENAFCSYAKRKGEQP